MLALITSYYLLPYFETYLRCYLRKVYIKKQGFVRNVTRTNERMK